MGHFLGNNNSTYVNLLQRKACLYPEKQVYVFLSNTGEIAEEISYGNLDLKARTLAAHLQENFNFGERILLLYPSGIDYITAFLGCLYAGLIAIPANPPRLSKHNRGIARLNGIINDIDAKGVLSDALTARRLKPILENSPLSDIRWIDAESLNADAADRWKFPDINSDTPAFLQYTSGTTQMPKGVVVTHGNILHNQQLLQNAFRHDSETKIVGWLPMYHDMGLIGNVLHPIYIGGCSILMSPLSFLQNPFLWLKSISSFKAKTSGGPNFAYDLCCSKISATEKSELDLSNWRTAFNGAETVKAATLEKFSEAFKECGFDKRAFYPCYGLAENTLIVTGGEIGEEPRTANVSKEKFDENLAVIEQDSTKARTLVSCGRILGDQRVKIVHPDLCTELPNGEIGEIWINGFSVAQGYWQKPEESQNVFQAEISGDESKEKYLRTGDLGCLIRDELFVAGRLKDLIIIRGRNLYPQDIETVSETSHSSCLPNSCAVFSVMSENEPEKLIVVQEVHRKSTDFEKIYKAIRQSIWDEFEIQPAAVVLALPGAIPKTSSGKIQRNLCRNLFIDGQLKTLSTEFFKEVSGLEGKLDRKSDLTDYADFEKDKAVLATALREIAAGVLDLNAENIAFSEPLTLYGLDSLKTVDLVYEIQRHFQTTVNIGDVLAEPTIDNLTSLVSTLTEEAETDFVTNEEEAPVGKQSLSYGQKALFFLHKIAPQSAAYNISRALLIKNEIDETVLKKSLSSIVRRHDLLNSIYIYDDEPRREYSENAEQAFQFSVENVEDLSFTEIKDLMEEEANRPFDLETGPLLRVFLFKKRKDEQYLLISLHHIICDLWSLEIFFRELNYFYESFAKNDSLNLTPIQFRYENYCERLENSASGNNSRKKLDFWKNTLKDDQQILNLPTDYPRPYKRSFSGRKKEFNLNKNDISDLRRICEEAGTTLFIGFLALYAIFIYRYTGQNSFFIGCPIAGRNDLRDHDIIGYFVNTLPVKIEIYENLSFADLVKQVKSSVTASLKNEYPFSLLVEKLGLSRDSGHLPVFQVMLVMLNSFASSAETLPLIIGQQGGKINFSLGEAESVSLDQHGSQSDLSLLLAESDEALLATFEYNNEIFAESTISAFTRSIDSLLSGLVSNPDRRLSDSDFLGEEEKQKILVRWNDTKKDYGEEFLFHKLISEQAQRSPAAIAIKFGEREMSYAELDELSNAFACKLNELGVNVDEIVAITLDRCFELLPAILGIIKSGAAYLPLDKNYPQERLLHIIGEAGCRVVVGNGSSDLSKSGNFDFIDIEEIWNDLRRMKNSAALPVKINEDNLAYVIYTSGSTGNPKGVMTSHRGIYNRLLWMKETYQVNSADKILQKTSLTFDVSVWELFLPLISGGTLIIAPPEAHRDPSALLRIIGEEEITILHFVPSVLKAVLNENASWAETLRLVVCSGESLSPEIVSEFKSKSEAQLHNLYGPTEASIDVTYWDCRQEETGQSIPIGRPISNTQIFILDDFLNPVPVGASGDLYLGGGGLARGYLKQPALTSQRFIPNPYSGTPGERIYQTGDRARYNKDGVIEFLGRLDDQIKLRGQRIELGEIETNLNLHPEINSAAVVMYEDENKNQFLAAFLVNKEHKPLSQRNIQHFLSQKLPPYMIPSVFIFMDELPLSKNGKLDRKALREAVSSLTNDKRHSSIPPFTPNQELMVEVWKQVLKVEKIGIDDNYFLLGGDSIKSISIIAKAKEFGLNVTLNQIFQYQTVRELAREAVNVSEVSKDSEPVKQFELIDDAEKIQIPEDVEDAYPMTYLQQGLVFHSEFGSDYEIYVTTLSVSKGFERERLEYALDLMTAKHEILRTSFNLKDFDNPLQLVHRKSKIQLIVDDLSAFEKARQDELIKNWIESEKKNRFDWEAPGFFRVFVHVRNDNSFQLTLSEPLFDGWSVASFLTELLNLYSDSGIFEKAALPQLSASFKDFVKLEKETLKSPEAVSYWQDTFDNWVAWKLPRLSKKIETESSQGIRRSQIIVESDLYQGLREISRKAEVPIKAVLLMAHLKVMSTLSGSSKVYTGLITNGRPEKEDGERVLGTHLNAAPFKLDLAAESWIELAKKTFSAEVELLPYRRFPVAELQNWHGGKILFETVFNFTNFHVYDSLREISNIEVSEGYASEQTYYPLTTQFNIDEEKSQLILALDYISSEFGSKQIDGYTAYFKKALEIIAFQPNTSPLNSSLLSENEKRKFIDDYNRIEVGNDLVTDLIEAIEEQAHKNGAKTAVVCDSGRITFKELDEKSNQVANFLKKRGISAEDKVSVCLTRNSLWIVCLLGVLKSGGAYVPLDPTSPPERLAYMIEDSRSKIILTETRFSDLFSKDGQTVALADENWNTFQNESKEKVSRNVKEQQLAYMIYTSGSTGQPKAVGVTHGGLLNLINWHLNTYKIDENDRTSHLAGQGFDASVWEIWTSLPVGASLHLPSDMIRISPVDLQKWVTEEKITSAFVPTPLAEEMLKLEWDSESELRFMLTGGDKLNRYPSQKLPFDLYNHYGPTENTVVATFCHVPFAPHKTESPLIGKPIANTQVYLLDSSGQLVPSGVAGELFLGGKSLARGYFGKPELTAEKFVPNPFSKEKGERLYRTGDIAVYTEDGSLKFVGRADEQIKIRGYRIELSEIENVLIKYPLVQKAIVLTRNNEINEKFLVAYIIPKAGESLNIGEIKQYLQAYLPAYMIPDAFIFLDAFPLDSSGKINRKSLPNPVETDFQVRTNIILPQDEIEEQILQVWKDILGKDQISADDNFFDLGGHSLLATQIISRLRGIFGVDLMISAIFESPTIQGLGETIQKLRLIQLDDYDFDAFLNEIENLSEEDVQAKLME